MEGRKAQKKTVWWHKHQQFLTVHKPNRNLRVAWTACHICSSIKCIPSNESQASLPTPTSASLDERQAGKLESNLHFGAAS